MAFVGGFYSARVPETALKSLLIAVLLVAGILMLKKPQKTGLRTTTNQKWWHWRRRFNQVDYSVNLPLVLSATAGIGLLSGMLGITGGLIKLPIMVLLCGVPMDIAIATSTIMVAVTAMSGLAGHVVHDTINWQTGLVLACAAVAGGLLGSKISLNTDKARLKRMFGIVVLMIAASLLLKMLWS
jgi:uncharacterized membrane protein YfcA